MAKTDLSEPPPALVEEARKNPNGWVYKIDPRLMNGDHTPFHAIQGWYKVDANGEIAGSFTPNPKYKYKRKSRFAKLISGLRNIVLDTVMQFRSIFRQ